MRAVMTCCILCLGLAWPALVEARPAERVLSMQTGEERAVPGPGSDWRVHSYAPERVQARVLKGSGEVFVKAVKQGEALLVLSNGRSRTAAFWRVLVGAPAPELRRPDAAPVKKACGCKADQKAFLDCQVADTACLDALDAYLKRADLQGEDLSLRFELSAMQALLARMQKALKEAGFPSVELGFLGGALVADGLVKDEAEWRRMMRVVHLHMLGRLSLRDRVKRMDQAKTKTPLSRPF